MTNTPAGQTEREDETAEEAAVTEWIERIERHIRQSPPLSDDQLRAMGVILGVRLTRRNAKPA
ncbi:hypothetical protein ITI46_24040 [Streptomyces oryzae]|uniref:PH domain-containing protein n=1 Tax=Streptomyces oryzae TaxID=1434886 RepID=A0ABS3XH28_9ACTN|nr:hypothetical protein [Streptomyces oryzae]MBO8194702.1 hypothetical protein [Streptomyces oryzae]